MSNKKLALIKCTNRILMNNWDVEEFTEGELYPAMIYKTKIYAINNSGISHKLFDKDLDDDGRSWFDNHFKIVREGKFN